MNKFYITNAIPYPNGKPHLGYGFEILLSDVLARYHRALGEEVHYLTGVDEHGLKVFQAAQKESIGFQEYVNRNSQIFRDLKQTLNISYNDFIRTTDKARHWPGVEKFWRECLKNGKIYKKTYTGLYCIGCEEFKSEKDLVKGICPEHKVAPEKVDEENYFFKLSDYTDQIKKILESDEYKIIPQSRKNEVLSFLNQGAEDFSISRPRARLTWGIPVPDDDTQTIYVWFDALINYITAIGYGRNDEEFNKWWPADIHVIGKGISRFHAIFWPAMLLAAGLELPKTLLIHGYINIEGEKISKSLGNVISPSDVLEKYPTIPNDALRYALLRYTPTTDDGNFSFEEFERVYNADLANGLGNLVARVSKLCEKVEFSSDRKITEFKEPVEKNIKEFKFNEALSIIWEKIADVDKKINQEEPWKLSDEDLKKSLENYIVAIQDIAFNLSPFLPETSDKILNQFSGSIKSSAPLFPRI